jgi:hypothetical protein
LHTYIILELLTYDINENAEKETMVDVELARKKCKNLLQYETADLS